ncbi:MAG: hypothetical protein K940chlam8_00780 [Chlamydiae bacterium]|nr:hypothetical protein [Chlamydiota bacterium]
MQRIIPFLFFSSLLFGATFTVLNTNDSGPESLRQAVIDANATPALDTINFGALPITPNISLVSRLDAIAKPVIINGTLPGPGVDGGSVNPIFDSLSSSIPLLTITLNNLFLLNGMTSGGIFSDGGIFVGNVGNGSLDITNCSIQDCNATNSGGAIKFDLVTGILNFTGNDFIRCHANSQGGALRIDAPTNLITNNTFDTCTASDGGAIFASGTTATTIVSSTFKDCISTSHGGGIHSIATNLNLADSTFTNCTSTSRGGGIYMVNNLNLTDCLFLNCTSTNGRGGAIYILSTSSTDIAKSTFTLCQANSGGGIYVNDATTIDLTDNTFTHCQATAGGAILLIADTVNMTDNIFNDCHATSSSGGGILLTKGNLNVIRASFTTCTAFADGGGIGIQALFSGNITDSNFTNCQANSGGAISADNITTFLNITDCFIQDCQTNSAGGGLYVNFIDIATVTNVTFTNCESNLGGGLGMGNLTDLNLTDCSFINCKANKSNNSKGGAINIGIFNNVSILGSAIFSGNSATGGGGDIFMDTDSTLTFNISSDVNIPNAIEGPLTPDLFFFRTFTKKGTTKLTLHGDNTYAAPTTIENGELNIFSGSTIADILIEENGTFSGNVHVKEEPSLSLSGDVTNNGTISPGNQNIGIMRIDGDFVQSTTGILKVDITPTAQDSDKIFIKSGKLATVEGTMEINIGIGNYIGGVLYTVIDGPTNIIGVTIVKTGPLKDSVEIEIVPGSLNILVTSTLLFPCDDVAAGNPQTMVNAIRNLDIQPLTPLAQIVEALGILPCPSQELNDTLNKMTAANYANLEWITLSTDTQASSIFANHAHSLKCAKKGACGSYKNTGFWINGLGNFEDVNSFDWLSGYEANTGGFLIGLDHCFNHFYFGMGGGYTYTDFDLKDNSGFGDIKSSFGAIYGSFITHYFIADASVLVGAKHFDMNRKVAFLMINAVSHSAFNSPFVNTHLGLMAKSTMRDFHLEVFGNIDYHYLYRTAILETGSPINLFITKHHSHFLKAEVGTHLKVMLRQSNICYVPFIGFSIIKKVPLGKTNYNARFENSDFCMYTLTSNTSQELASPQCGIRIHTRSFNFMISYKGEFNKYTKDHQVDGHFEWTF